MVYVINLYEDEQILKKIKPFIDKKQAIMSDNNALFVKEECKDSIIKILDKDDNSYINFTDDVFTFLDYYDDCSYIKYKGKEFSKSECIDKLCDKIRNDENIINKIFNLKSNEIEDYIVKLIDKSLSDVIEDYINDLKEFQTKIKSNNKIEWR